MLNPDAFPPIGISETNNAQGSPAESNPHSPPAPILLQNGTVSGVGGIAANTQLFATVITSS